MFNAIRPPLSAVYVPGKMGTRGGNGALREIFWVKPVIGALFIRR